MANYCDFELRAVGNENDIMSFEKYMNRVMLKEISPFPRWVDIDVISHKHLLDNKMEVEIVGTCAWSVYTAMRDRDYVNEETLESLSELYNIEIEVYSEESGCQFQEHFYVDKGNIVIDDCEDWAIYYFEDQAELDDFNAAHQSNYSLYEDIEVGGIENKCWEI